MKKMLAAIGFILTVSSVILIVLAYLKNTKTSELYDDMELGI